VLYTPYFGCLFVGRLLFLDGKMVGFGDNCSTILAFFEPGKSVNDGSSCLKQRESIHFCDFWHFNDDFAIKNATKTIFKAKKARSYY
jgi:hypothetical protein